jgi:amino acid transporter
VLGFKGGAQTLDKSDAPMDVLANNAGMPPILGILINLGALVSFFSCLLACITASARVLFLMGQKGDLPAVLGRAHSANQTPHRAVAISGLATFLPLGILILRGTSALDIFGLLGTLATFGFLTAYILVSIAAPMFLRAQRRLGRRDVVVSALALLAMGWAFWGNIYPLPPYPYSYLPYVYLGLLSTGLGWSIVQNSRTAALGQNASPSA